MIGRHVTEPVRPVRRLLVAASVVTLVLLGVGMDAVATPPEPPDDLGADPELDALAQSCFDGDMLACDELFLRAPVGSDYEAYGDTCGGRQSAGTRDYCALGGESAGPP